MSRSLPPSHRRLWHVALILGSLGVGAVLRRRYLVVDVGGGSMVPTLLHGDRAVVRRLGKTESDAGLQLGDVALFLMPDAPRGPGHFERLVKRVHGLPGDLLPEGVDPVLGCDERFVPEGYVALLGDSPGVDSTTFGCVPLDRVEGVVVRRMRRVSSGCGRRVI